MDEREHKFAASRAVGNPGLISTEVEKGRPLLWYAGTMIGTSDQASHAPGDPDMKNKSTTSRGAIYRSLDHRGSERSVQTGTISPTKLATCASSAAASTAVRSINEKPPASPRHGISGATPPAPAPTPFHVQSVPVAANTQQLAPDCLSLLQGLLRAVMPTTGHLSGPQQARREPLQVTNPPPNGWEQAAISGVPLRAIPLSPSVLRRQDPMLELLQRKIERERGCWV